MYCRPSQVRYYLSKKFIPHTVTFDSTPVISSGLIGKRCTTTQRSIDTFPAKNRKFPFVPPPKNNTNFKANLNIFLATHRATVCNQLLIKSGIEPSIMYSQHYLKKDLSCSNRCRSSRIAVASSELNSSGAPASCSDNKSLISLYFMYNEIKFSSILFSLHPHHAFGGKRPGFRAGTGTESGKSCLGGNLVVPG